MNSMLSNPHFRGDPSTRPGARPAPMMLAAALQFVQFPQSFEELMIECLAERSAFIRAQRECIGDSGRAVAVKVPSEAGKHWVRAVMSTPASLRATDDAKLVQYLKASEFFQDSYMVKFLCSVVGERLFPKKQIGFFRSSNSSPRDNAGSRRHLAQVVEGLPADLTMEVLRSAPGSFKHKLTHLPDSLKPLATLAECPGLASACMLPSECPDTASSLPEVEFCFDMNRTDQNGAVEAAVDTVMHDNNIHEGGNSRQSSHSISSLRESAAGESIWVHTDEVSENNVDTGLFSMHQRPGTVVCKLVARSRTIKDVRICLPQGACVVFGGHSGAVHMKSVKFQGGAVVCMGMGCNVTFEDSVFEGCTLVVLNGAHAAVERPLFIDMHESTSRLSICASGSASQVVVQGGTITGGLQGVAVMGGARLHATDMIIRNVEVAGVEVKDQGSHASLTGCKLHAFDFHHEDVWAVRGVFVHNHCTAHLDTVVIAGMCYGVTVGTHASATIANSTVADTVGTCMVFCNSGIGHLESCTLSGSQRSHGLYVGRAGSRVNALKCKFLRNTMRGAVAINGGTLLAEGCVSSGNRGEGYTAVDEGSLVELTGCSSTANYIGCEACFGGKIRAHKVDISETQNQGVGVHNRGEIFLRDCTATRCRQSGVRVQDVGSRLEAEGCEFVQNGQCGAFVSRGSVVVVRGCRSSENGESGYYAELEGQMTVSGSTSDGNKEGCGVRSGGLLTMEGVSVDGVLRSGTLPWAHTGRPATY